MNRYQKKNFLYNKLNGSYTVEAAFIMIVVLLVISAVIKEGFYLHDQVRGTLVLQEMVENVRRDEWEHGIEAAVQLGNKKSAPLFTFSDYYLSLKDQEIFYQGAAQSGSWKKEIQIRVFNPEEFLRLVRGLIL